MLVIVARMINDREISFRLGDVGMAGSKYFLTDVKRAEINLFRLRKTLLVCIKDAEIIQYGSDIGIFRPELAFVNLKSTELVWFSGGAAAGLAAYKSNIVQQRAEIRTR